MHMRMYILHGYALQIPSICVTACCWTGGSSCRLASVLTFTFRCWQHQHAVLNDQVMYFLSCLSLHICIKWQKNVCWSCIFCLVDGSFFRSFNKTIAIDAMCLPMTFQVLINTRNARPDCGRCPGASSLYPGGGAKSTLIWGARMIYLPIFLGANLWHGWREWICGASWWRWRQGLSVIDDDMAACLYALSPLVACPSPQLSAPVCLLNSFRVKLFAHQYYLQLHALPHTSSEFLQLH